MAKSADAPALGAGGRKAVRVRVPYPAPVPKSWLRHCVQYLDRQLAAGLAFADRGVLLTDETGGPVRPNSLAIRFRRLIAAAGVPAILFHDLRHTCATLLLSQGVHPKIVQERLGHTDIAMTMNLYSHVTADMQRQAADHFDAAIEDAAKSA
ncbi:MAG: hypothetical protein QOJ59_15 [Thermomicrobiales bacterium]|nr:hypothetical protein [Thermomicrobiales bacterium]